MCLKCSSYRGHWKNHTRQHAFNDLQLQQQHWLSLAVGTVPVQSLLFLQNVFGAQETNGERAVSTRALQSQHNPAAVIIFA